MRRFPHCSWMSLKMSFLAWRLPQEWIGEVARESSSMLGMRHPMGWSFTTLAQTSEKDTHVHFCICKRVCALVPVQAAKSRLWGNAYEGRTRKYACLEADLLSILWQLDIGWETLLENVFLKIPGCSHSWKQKKSVAFSRRATTRATWCLLTTMPNHLFEQHEANW